MCNIADIMTPKVLTVAADAGVDDTAWGLTLTGLSGAPVTDEQGNLIGVISKSDLVDPHKHGWVERPQTAQDSMTPLLFAARTTDPVKFAIRRMVETGAHRLIVIDESGALAGIVTPIDVLRGLLQKKISPSDF